MIDVFRKFDPDNSVLLCLNQALGGYIGVFVCACVCMPAQCVCVSECLCLEH